MKSPAATTDSPTFERVSVRLLNEDGTGSEQENGSVQITRTGQVFQFTITSTANGSHILESIISKETKGFRFGTQSFTLNIGAHPVVLYFPSGNECTGFCSLFQQITQTDSENKSLFDQRTENASAAQYFQFYGYLSQQQNMMQDYIRTSTYQSAILQNANEFKGKVVLDVGAGTGILSYFAVQAGAKKVYAVEASNMAEFAAELAKSNNMSSIVEVIAGKIEEINLPEEVDIIISEPMGYMLFNERMLETYLHAKKWLKPGGNMYPTKGDLYVAPFTDDALFMEHFGKSDFWCQNSFYGVNLKSLRQPALQEYFKQPIVDTFDVRILMAKPCVHSTNFLTTAEEELHKINIPLQYTMLSTGTLHGLAFWFDVGFLGQISHVYLSTAPQEPLTHWYQVRCLLPNPIFVRAGQKVSGHVVLHANNRQSYDVEIEVSVDGTGVRSSNILDLKNPFFRYTGVQAAPPPGNQSQSPTEGYWNSSSVVLNGGSMNACSQYSGQAVQAGGLSAYTPQAGGNVMATGNASYSSIPPPSLISTPPQNYSGQTVQIGSERYIIAANQPQYEQGMYISGGMSG